jgi:hypothetical protein
MTTPRCYRGLAGQNTGRTPCGATTYGAVHFTDSFAEVTCTDCRWHELANRCIRRDVEAARELGAMALAVLAGAPFPQAPPAPAGPACTMKSARVSCPSGSSAASTSAFSSGFILNSTREVLPNRGGRGMGRHVIPSPGGGKAAGVKPLVTNGGCYKRDIDCPISAAYRVQP